MVNLGISREQLKVELDDIHQRIAELSQVLVDGERREQSQESLFLNSPIAIYLIHDGVFKSVSPQLRQITGYSEAELIGTSLLNLVLREDRDTLTEHMGKLLNGEKPSVHAFRIVTKNASIKWVMETASPILHDGKRAITASVMDITEHKEAEEALKRSEEKYHDLCENSTDMILCIAPDGRLLYANHAWRETLGYGQDKIAGLSLFEFMPRDYVQHYLELFQQVISGESMSNVESVFVDNDGNRLTVEGNLNCRFTDGKPVYIRGIFRDVTERKQSQQEADSLVRESQEINRRLEQSNREPGLIERQAGRRPG